VKKKFSTAISKIKGTEYEIGKKVKKEMGPSEIGIDAKWEKKCVKKSYVEGNSSKMREAGRGEQSRGRPGIKPLK